MKDNIKMDLKRLGVRTRTEFNCMMYEDFTVVKIQTFLFWIFTCVDLLTGL
jgi:hypothetical protein